MISDVYEAGAVDCDADRTIKAGIRTDCVYVTGCATSECCHHPFRRDEAYAMIIIISYNDALGRRNGYTHRLIECCFDADTISIPANEAPASGKEACKCAENIHK